MLCACAYTDYLYNLLASPISSVNWVVTSAPDDIAMSLFTQLRRTGHPFKAFCGLQFAFININVPLYGDDDTPSFVVMPDL